MAKQKQKKNEDPAGLAFVGCLFIGLALGLFYDNAAVGVLGGLGAGFIAMAIIKAAWKK